ncbi:oligosaccharide flippase family protein [Desulfoplanes sp.]
MIRDTFYLIVCRFLNYIILFISPVFLVRILSVEHYGMYREFILYSGMIANFAAFSINKSLIYFLSKYNNDIRYISNSIYLNLIVTVVVMFLVILFKKTINENSSYDFVFPLLMYLVFFLNLDYCESYWIVKRNIGYVLYYTCARSFLRNITVIMSSYFFDSVISIVYGLILVEMIRFLFVFIYTFKNKFIKIKIHFWNFKNHFRYILPMGISNFVLYFNKEISKFIVLYTMGVEYLAFYSIGCYQVPIIGIFRGSIGDMVFSEACIRSSKSLKNALELWKKTNIIYLTIVMPFFVVFFFYSQEFITIFFTEKYIKSVIIFKLYMLLMIKECFETGMPIRIVNKNKFYVYAYNYALAINIVLLFVLNYFFRFVGPAIAYIVSDSFVYIYLGKKILNIYQIKISEIFYWKKISCVILASFLLTPVLFSGELFEINELIKIILFSCLYFLAYFIVLINIDIEEFQYIYRKVCIKKVEFLLKIKTFLKWRSYEV